jgi:ribosomal protein L2
VIAESNSLARKKDFDPPFFSFEVRDTVFLLGQSASNSNIIVHTPNMMNGLLRWRPSLRCSPLSLSVLVNPSMLSRPLHATCMSLKKKAKDSTKSSNVIDDGRFKTFKPTTPGLRFRKLVNRDHLWKGPPEKSLTTGKRNTGGRNRHGRITVRHRGGGVKRRLRMVDWKRETPGLQSVVRLEYDPNLSAHLALLKHQETGGLSYIVAPHDLQVGGVVQSFRAGLPQVEGKSLADILATPGVIEKGNCLQLKHIPVGTLVHCIALRKGGKAQMCRSAGTYGQVVFTADSGYAQVKLQSGEVRKINVEAVATIGTVSNPDHKHRILGKAGVSRRLGRRPSVRGVAMNPVDHPHGGGTGKSKGGRHPVTPWGKLTKGKRTSLNRNARWVVKKRPRGPRSQAQ